MRRYAIVLLTVMLTIVVSQAETATVDLVTIEVPSGFKAETRHEKDSLGDLEVNRWLAKDGRVLELLYYATSPKQDRGSMVVANEEEIEVVGQKTMLIETKQFFGAPKEVFVVYLHFGDSTYIIDSEHMAKSEFKAILTNLKIVK